MHILYRKDLHAIHKLVPRVTSLVCDNFEPYHLNNNLVANIQNTRKLCIESPDLWLLLEQIRKGGHSHDDTVHTQSLGGGCAIFTWPRTMSCVALIILTLLSL